LEQKLGTLANFRAERKDWLAQNSVSVVAEAPELPPAPVEQPFALHVLANHPAEAAVPESSSPSAAMDYKGGVLPEELRAWSRERRRAACLPQEIIAERMGLSRPQLANAEAGRFGLSSEAAARFISTVAALPVRQDLML
jgi:hypothetical protein